MEDSKLLTARLVEAIRPLECVSMIEAVDTESAAVTILTRSAVDVLILDLHLKQGTGFGVMRTLGREGLKLQVIVLTNYDLPEYKDAALRLGATHFLDKARDYPRLLTLLAEMQQAGTRLH